MEKDATYHESAIQYNEELADFANKLSKRLKHEEIARWSRAVAKQHNFHAARHKRALRKVVSEKAAQETETSSEGVVATPKKDDIAESKES